MGTGAVFARIGSRAPLHQVSELAPRERVRQWLPSLFERLDRLVDKLAEFREHLFGIVAVATAIEQLRAAADEAVVFI